MKFFSTLLFVAFCTTQIAAQNILIVDNTRLGEVQPPVYKELQAAIDAAQAGDVIHVMPSQNNYHGNNVGTSVGIKVNTIGKSISIFGPGFNPGKEDAPNLRANVGSIEFVEGAANVRLSGLLISSLLFATDLQGLMVDKCIVGGEIRAAGQYNYANFVIRNSILQATFAVNNVSGFIVTNNVINGSGSGGNNIDIHGAIMSNKIVGYGSGGSGSATDCVFKNNTVHRSFSLRNSTVSNNVFRNTQNSTIDDDRGNIARDNIFEETAIYENFTPSGSSYFPDMDFRLTSESPGKGGGSDGKDMGVYGGDTPFEPMGGALPSVQAIIAPLMIPAGEDVTIEVKAKAY